MVDDVLAASLYKSMLSVEGLRPCAFTLPNFPDYDDSCGHCDGGFGTWVSGGSWSTAEGRAILAHFRGGSLDWKTHGQALINKRVFFVSFIIHFLIRIRIRFCARVLVFANAGGRPDLASASMGRILDPCG